MKMASFWNGGAKKIKSEKQKVEKGQVHHKEYFWSSELENCVSSRFIVEQKISIEFNGQKVDILSLKRALIRYR